MSGGALLSNVVLFGRVLRGVGLDVHPGRMLDAVTAIGWVGVRSRGDLRATLRALLVHRHEDLPTFDEAFELFWRAHEAGAGGLPLFALGERPRVVARRVAGSDVGLEIDRIESGSDRAVRFAAGAYSPVEVSRTEESRRVHRGRDAPRRGHRRQHRPGPRHAEDAPLATGARRRD